MKPMPYSAERPNPEFFALLDNHEAERHDDRFDYGASRAAWDMIIIGAYRLTDDNGEYGFQRLQEALIQPGPQQGSYFGANCGYRSAYLEIIEETGDGVIAGSIDYLEDSHSTVLRDWNLLMARIDEDIFDTSYVSPDTSQCPGSPYILGTNDYTLYKIPDDSEFQGPGYPNFSARGSTAGLLIQDSNGPVSYILAGTYLDEGGEIDDDAEGTIKVYSNPFPSRSSSLSNGGETYRPELSVQRGSVSGSVRILSNIDGTASLLVIDLAGRIVSERSLEISAGQWLQVNAFEETCSDLPPGVYMVAVKHQDQIAAAKISLIR